MSTVVVFSKPDEILMFASKKAKPSGPEDLTGYDEWFKDTGRNPEEYTVTSCFLGGKKDGVICMALKAPETDCEYEDNLDYWFEEA